MKKVFLTGSLCLATLLMPEQTAAQQVKGSQSFSVGVGAISTERFLDMSDDIVRGIAVVGSLGYYNASINNRQYGPVFHVNYHKTLTDDLSIGLASAYEKASGDYEQNNQKVGNFVRHSYTLAAEGKYLYLNEQDFSLYGAIGLGITLNQHETQKPAEWTDFVVEKRHFNGHVTPLGFRAGRQLAGFAELGFGYKGFLNVGLDYRF